MKKTDIVLLFLVCLLTFFGLFIIYDASSYIAFRDFKDSYYYVKQQSIWMVLGFIGLAFFTRFDYKKFYNLALPMLLVALFLLLLVLIPGVGVRALGAHRWINLHFFVLQPAEFVKLTLAIYLAAWFSGKEKNRFNAFLLLMAIVLGLVMLEPDMGTTIIILSEALIVYYISGGRLMPLLASLPIMGIVGFILIKLEPYRASRFAAFLNPMAENSTSSYHVKQILIALGSGGLFGVGIGNSLQKYAYLPENTTDSIFAIIAEELGFIGATIVMILFATLIWRGFVIATRAKDTFGKLLAGAIVAFLGMQVFINLGAQTALLPLTGVPLPFISYGGSALVIDMCSVGILLNIARRK